MSVINHSVGLQLIRVHIVREYILSSAVQSLIVQLLSDAADQENQERILQSAPFFGGFQDRSDVSKNSTHITHLY